MPPLQRKNSKSKNAGGGKSTDVANQRASLPAPDLPDLSQVTSEWNPELVDREPKEIFAEWPASLSAENWFTAECPFTDEAFNAQQFDFGDGRVVSWKRPCEFLPVIPDPTAAPAPATEAKPTPPVNAKKGAAANAAAMAKREQQEPPKPKHPPKHAHIFYTDPPAHPPTPLHLHGESEALPPRSKTPMNNTVAPATTTPSIPLPRWLPTQKRIPRPFRRVWSPEQIEELQKWRLEQDRVERELECFGSQMMEYEDKVSALVVNGRLPDRNFQEQEIDPSDLIDDGAEDDEDMIGQAFMDLVIPRMEVLPNPIMKPEIPCGDVVEGDLASYLMLIDDILFANASCSVPSPSVVPVVSGIAAPPTVDADSSRFLWQNIYPQDAAGIPQYNPGGKYSVRLFCFGKWRKVDVDDKLPVDQDQKIVFLSSVMRNEIWPTLIAKALYKVMGFFGYSAMRKQLPVEGIEEVHVDVLSRLQMVMSCLTGWKVSRWLPIVSRDNWQEELLNFIPQKPVISERGEVLVPVDAPAGEPSLGRAGGNNALRTRVMLCCHSPEGIESFAFREACLVHEIIGDGPTAVFKFRHPLHGNLTVLPGDSILKDQVSVVMVHLPFKHQDLLTSSWTNIPPTETSPAIFKPFGNPRLQYVAVQVPTIDPPGDTAASMASETDKPSSCSIDMVVTLTSIPPTKKRVAVAVTPDPAPDAVVGGSEVAAVSTPPPTEINSAPIPQMETNSLINPKRIILMRDPRLSIITETGARPIIAHVSEMCSSRVSLTPGTHVFHITSDTSLQMGYTLQVEAANPVRFLDFATVLRDFHAFNVVESDGEFPIQLAGSWSIVLKKSVAWVADKDKPPALLFIDLHLSDTSMTPLMHVLIVNNDTNEVQHLSMLTAVIKLPETGSGITIIVDCSPVHQAVPSGEWHLTLGSTAKLTLQDIPSAPTAFSGIYTPNKTLTCFRDVIHVPGEASLSSFQFSLWQKAPGAAEQELVKARQLAAKLEVIEVQTEKVIWETFALGETRIWQLPRLPNFSENDDKPRYILQGSIDLAHCVVPNHLRSVRPFAYRLGVVDNQDEDDSQVDNNNQLASQAHDFKIQWRLNCWSTDDVKIAPDLAKENRHEAIRRSWAEASKDRDTNGKLSRLLFLRQPDQFEQQVAKLDAASADAAPLVARIKERYEWFEAALACRQQFASSSQFDFFKTESCDDATQEELVDGEVAQQQTTLAIQQAIANDLAAMESRRQKRLLNKEKQPQTLRRFIASEKKAREQHFRQLHALWLQREEIRKELVASFPSAT